MWRKLALLASGVIAGPLLAIYAFVFLEPVKVLPRLEPAPGFLLTDQGERPLGSESLRGSLTLIAFAHSRCTGLCADALERQREVQERLTTEPIGLPVRLITVSIDPEHDTPERLRAWAAGLGADTEVWSFLTGEPQSIRRLVSIGYGAFYTQQPDGSWNLDTRMALVDGWGIIRAEYGTHEYLPSTDRLWFDLRLVADEALAADGPARLAYDAAQLFGCYP